MRALMLAAAVWAAGCAWTPTAVCGREDVRGDEDRRRASARLCAWLGDGDADPAVRMAAARTLGRLRQARAEEIAALRAVLLRPGEEPPLRATAAWALGQMRSDSSLQALVEALRVPLEDETGDYLLEALARHVAIIEREAERAQRVVEGLVYLSGNRRRAPPAMYDYLGARLRTPETNRRVLEATLAAGRNDDGQRLAVYQAARELLRSLQAAGDAIRGRPRIWQPLLDGSIAVLGRVFAGGDGAARAMVLHRLGRLAGLPEAAVPAARWFADREPLPGLRPFGSAEPRLRLIGLWALYRMLPHAVGPRACLLREWLPHESDTAVLDLARALSPAGADALQKIIRADPEEAR
jgi:hypothetical protein